MEVGRLGSGCNNVASVDWKWGDLPLGCNNVASSEMGDMDQETERKSEEFMAEMRMTEWERETSGYSSPVIPSTQLFPGWPRSK